MTTVTRTFDRKETKNWEQKKIMNKETITKETTTSLSKYISNKTKKYSTDNQDTFIESDILVIGPLKTLVKCYN